MKTTYENKFYLNLKRALQNQYRIASLVIVTIIFGLTILTLVTSSIFEMKESVKDIKIALQSLIVSNESYLTELSQMASNLDNQDELNQIYSSFYTRENNLRGDELFIFSSEDDLLFSTDYELIDNSLMLFNIGNIINGFKENHGNNQTLYSVITTYDGITYLLIYKQTAAGKYGILVHQDALKNYLGYSQIAYIITNRFDHILLSNDNINDGLKFSSNDFAKGLGISNGYLYYQFDEKLFDNLYIYADKNIAHIYSLAFLMLLIVMITYSILLYLSNRLANTIASKSSQNINKLTEQTYLVANSYKKYIDFYSEDEFQYLSDEINKMLYKITDLYERQLEIEKEKTVYERMILEYQFNPHFLFNTLEAIRTTVLMDSKIAEQLIISLTKVLKYSLRSRSLVNIVEDIKVLEEFLTINQLRFNRFTYTINIENEADQIRIPKLLLLPIVENTLKYGRKYRTDIHINIQVKIINSQVVIEVEDNGPGIKSERIMALNKLIRTNDKLSHGLINTYRRIRLISPEANLKLENGDEGLIVTISWPIKEKRDVQTINH